MRPAYSKLSTPGFRSCAHDAGGRLIPAIVLGRKFCPGCGRWRSLCDFAPTKYRGPCARCRACARAQNRATVERRTRDAERHRLWVEYSRIYQEAKRREAGIPERRWGPHSHRIVDQQVERILLEPGPLIVALEDYHDGHLGGGEFSWVRLAGKAGTDAKAIERLMSGESAHVRIDLADKLAVALGLTLTLIYGYEEAA